MTSEQNVPSELDETQWLSATEALEQADSLARVDVGSEPAEEAPPRYGFRVGSIGLLIRPDCISEVVKLPPIHPIPNTPAWLNGILNLRGNLVPAFDLALMLEERVAFERPLLLVIDRGEWAAGVKIEGFPQPPDVFRRGPAAAADD